MCFINSIECFSFLSMNAFKYSILKCVQVFLLNIELQGKPNISIEEFLLHNSKILGDILKWSNNVLLDLETRPQNP